MSRVSIISPCYNSARFIEQTVASVRAQTLNDWDMVVVDDGSKDDPEAALARHLAEEPRLRLLRQANGGVASARNAGFRASAPDSAYLMFLDADDCLKPDALAELTRYLDMHEDVGLVYCDPTLIDADGNDLRSLNGSTWWKAERLVPSRFGIRDIPAEVRETPLESIFALTMIIPSISLIRRSVYEKTQGFNESFGQGYEDMDVFIQIALQSKIHYLPRNLILYRQHAAQDTTNTDRLWNQERKLFEKWRKAASEELPPESAERVKAALRFREGRIIPGIGFTTAQKHLRQGQFKTGLRFFFGALKRYAPSLPHTSFKNTGGSDA